MTPRTKPPVPIELAFKPEGQLRRFRLSTSVGFGCSRCHRDIHSPLVATVGGKWNKLVCDRCYERAVKARREQQAKKKTKKSKLRLETRLKTRQPWQAQRAPERHHAEMSTTERRQLATAVAAHARFGEGLRAYLRSRDGAFIVMREDVLLATIKATEASVPHHGWVRGNFLAAGSHWERLADLVHEAEPELVAEHERRAADEAAEAARARGVSSHRAAEPQVPMRRLDRFPETTGVELVEACVEASRQIRLERQVAYDRAVVLESSYGELTLLPITGGGVRLRAPFRVRRVSGVVKGAILVGEATDPLPVVIEARVAEDDAVGVWACALLGFAAATCFEPEPTDLRVSQRPSPSPSRASKHVASRGGRQGGPQPRTVPRRRSWPAHLEPIGAWTRYRGSFVAGHRRHLSDGRSASAEARERALNVGIVLGTRETWVQPHTRGIPDHIEMRFLWHSPDALDAS